MNLIDILLGLIILVFCSAVVILFTMFLCATGIMQQCAVPITLLLI